MNRHPWSSGCACPEGPGALLMFNKLASGELQDLYKSQRTA